MMRRWLLAVAMVLCVVVPLVPAQQAEAFAGRAKWHGYFFDGLDTNGGSCGGGDVLCGGVFPGAATPAADFINRIWGALTGPAGQNSTGAAFIVLTMLGYPPGTSKAQAAAVFWTDWVPAVNYYDSQGWVNWFTWASGAVQNTYWQGVPGPDDVAWYDDVVSSEAILFLNPNTGSTYWIRKACANPLGNLGALTLPDYNVSLTADRNGSPFAVVAGQTYSVGATVASDVGSAANSEPGVLQVMMPGSGVCTPGASCPLNQAAVPVTAVSAAGYRGAGTIPPPATAGPNWYWNTNPLAPGASMRATMQFTVSPAAAPNSIITFNLYYYKGDRGGAVRTATIDFRVVSVRTPGVVGLNADIHAGGGLCGGASQAGQVRGYPGSSSMGEYVVAASGVGGINNFKSNGTGADNLKVGQNGAYAQVCRPDLLAAANDYRNGVGFSTIGSAPPPSIVDFDVTGKSGVYFYDGGTLTIHGTVSSKLTLVATAGKVVVNGPIQISGASFAPRDVPSLGVIANGNIEIRAGVTRVDAYLFSNSTIDTCSDGAALPLSSVCATAPLVVNGFLMGRDIAFRRLGPLNTNGSPVTERITLNPQIYLNPPKLFDASVDDLLLEGQGERQPLF